MSKKNNEEEVPEKLIFGRVRNHLKMGVVGLPNVGKSSLFNLLTKQQVRAENYPFCTREPNIARVTLPDPRIDYLTNLYNPNRTVPGYLEIVDIAGLVRGASEGAGLGNEFLSHINAVDGIFHVVRVFDNEEVTHVEGNVDAIRDLEIISHELRLKDIQMLESTIEPIRRLARADPTKRTELDAYEKALENLRSGHDIRNVEWNTREFELINEMLFLTSKPIIYIINMAFEDYTRQKNRWLPRVKNWIQEHSPGAVMIPMSVAFEQIYELTPDTEKEAYLEGLKTKTLIPRIITTGFKALNLINFFTVGEDEVKAWVLREGMTAPKAAGTIHTDFEKKFIRAEVMKYDDLRELGSENAVKGGGKYYTEGKSYIVQDGDIILFKHAAGGGGKKK